MSVPFRIKLPATSANLGAAFDCGAVALDLYLTVEAEPAAAFAIAATGRNADLCGRVEGNLILETYGSVLMREGCAVTPLTLRVHNEIPLGMGCGSSAAGRIAAIALANHFGGLEWTSQRILEEASEQEGHPDNAAACWLGGMVVAACQGGKVHVARATAPSAWRAMIVMPDDPLATSHARAVLPEFYSRRDVVANIQAASLLGLAFASGRGDLLKQAMNDCIHQPYRAALCPLLPLLLPLAGEGGVLGVALSGAGPSVLLILGEASAAAVTEKAVEERIGRRFPIEMLGVGFAEAGGSECWPRANL